MAFVSLKETMRNWLAGEPVKIEEGGTNADTAASACANLGAVKKSGDTMSGALYMANISGIKTSANAPEFNFYNGEDQLRCSLRVNAENRFFVAQRETGTTYAENYRLPALATGLTADKTYEILTTKGDYTMSGKITMGNSPGIKSSDATLQYWFRDGNGDYRGAVKLSSDNRFCFSQRNTAGATYAECYLFPTNTTETLTADKWYNIITTKNLSTFFSAGNTILSSKQYGTSLPAAGTAGRIFFKKAT